MVSNIKFIRRLSAPMEMVDMSVEGVRMYYSNSFISHNCSQEIALAANMSQEEGLLYPLRHGLDVHMYVAEKMFHVSDPNFRSRSKSVSFGKLYGGGSHLLAQRLNISVQEAKDLIEHYDKTMPVLKHWQDALVRSAQRTGFAFTYFGRSIYLARFFSSGDKGLQAYGTRVARNAPLQGCLPQHMYMGCSDGFYRPWRDLVGQRVRFDSGRLGVPTYRGTDRLYLVLLHTGDFVICNGAHKFLEAGSERTLLGLDDLVGRWVSLAPPRSRSVWRTLRGFFTRGRLSMAQLSASAQMGRAFKEQDPAVLWCLFKSWVFRRRYRARTFMAANVLRSVLDLFGYNLVFDFLDNVEGSYTFRVARRRSRRGRVVRVDDLGVSGTVISPSMCTGLQMYPLSGFVHKNTGGDLIRRVLIKFVKLSESNPEFGDNVKFSQCIHDELQVRVRRPYLQKAIRYMQEIMNFWPSNFAVPLQIEPCVGWSSGLQLDIVAVAEDGFVIPKGYTPSQEYLDAHKNWYYLDSWEKSAAAKRTDADKK